jgi:hypothetical protein
MLKCAITGRTGLLLLGSVSLSRHSGPESVCTEWNHRRESVAEP